MNLYLTKTPDIIKPFGRDLLWHVNTSENELYLTFDDGPVVGVTEYVLDILKKYKAAATFFCVGENAMKNPGLLNRIVAEGHRIANHSFNHLSGWKTANYTYYKNILKARKYIDSILFRPPYGRITRQQTLLLKKRFKIIMWDVLSGDFDNRNTPEICTNNVIKASKPGSIIVFHDSLKAKKNVLESLPLVLEHFALKGFTFKKLPDGKIE